MSPDSPALDPDLPGDETFQPTGPSVEVVINGMSAVAMTVSPEAQAATHHNRLRYAELQKARLGLPNRYAESRYR